MSTSTGMNLDEEFEKMLHDFHTKKESTDDTKLTEKKRYRMPKDKLYEPVDFTQLDIVSYGPFYKNEWIHCEQEDDEMTPEVLRRKEIVDKLMKIEYPAQRSPQWHADREAVISASDGGTALGLNKHEPQYKIIVKKVLGAPFQSNEFCYHGKKYEKIATSIYEMRMNVRVLEFGLVRHPAIKFLGASPDGIVGFHKHDGTHLTRHVGEMVEIKCPLIRKIKQTGEIKDDIVPIYYWVQVQLQLECCDLDRCCFWQCELYEYRDRNEFLWDTQKDEPFRSLKTGFEKGCLIQIIPKSRVEETKENYLGVVHDVAEFIYPPSVEMTPHETDIWALETIEKIKTDEQYKDFIFDRVVYWRLNKSSHVMIERDKAWFAKNLPVFEKIWKYIEFYRNPDNVSAKEELRDYIESLEVKSNAKIMKFIDDQYNKNLVGLEILKKEKVKKMGDGKYVDAKDILA